MSNFLSFLIELNLYFFKDLYWNKLFLEVIVKLLNHFMNVLSIVDDIVNLNNGRRMVNKFKKIEKLDSKGRVQFKSSFQSNGPIFLAHLNSDPVFS